MKTSRDSGVEAAGNGASVDLGRLSVVLNGERRAVDAGLNVAGLLRSLDLEPGMVVVEHNREILARDAFGATPVEDGDRIELVHFVGGG